VCALEDMFKDGWDLLWHCFRCRRWTVCDRRHPSTCRMLCSAQHNKWRKVNGDTLHRDGIGANVHTKSEHTDDY
jgi:hypothetical protein